VNVSNKIDVHTHYLLGVDASVDVLRSPALDVAGSTPVARSNANGG